MKGPVEMSLMRPNEDKTREGSQELSSISSFEDKTFKASYRNVPYRGIILLLFRKASIKVMSETANKMEKEQTP